MRGKEKGTGEMIKTVVIGYSGRRSFSSFRAIKSIPASTARPVARCGGGGGGGGSDVDGERSNGSAARERDRADGISGDAVRERE